MQRCGHTLILVASTGQALAALGRSHSRSWLSISSCRLTGRGSACDCLVGVMCFLATILPPLLPPDRAAERTGGGPGGPLLALPHQTLSYHRLNRSGWAQCSPPICLTRIKIQHALIAPAALIGQRLSLAQGRRLCERPCPPFHLHSIEVLGCEDGIPPECSPRLCQQAPEVRR